MILGNVTYRYVKQRVHNDSIELLCLRNSAKMQFNEAGNTFFRLVNDFMHFPGSKTVTNTDIQKIYTPAYLVFSLNTPEDVSPLPNNFLAPLLCSGHARRSERPPIFAPLFG